MKAIVTGGAGFIGSHMVDLLVERGCDVVVIDNLAAGRRENLAQHSGNPRVAICHEDINDLPADSAWFVGVDYVFHFGGVETSSHRSSTPLSICRSTSWERCGY